jgi:hypothetical protein
MPSGLSGTLPGLEWHMEVERGRKQLPTAE